MLGTHLTLASVKWPGRLSGVFVRKTFACLSLWKLPTPSNVESFSFDAIGNSTSPGYVTNMLNQYTSLPDGIAIAYDSDGNTTRYGNGPNNADWTYAYDALDRLIDAHPTNTHAEIEDVVRRTDTSQRPVHPRVGGLLDPAEWKRCADGCAV